jgi:preprotein translocase subunit SecF
MSKPETSAKNTLDMLKDGPLDVYKARWFFIIISVLFLIPGVYFIISNWMNPEIGAPLRLGIDFKGGTMLEYGFSKPVTQQDIDGIRLVFDKHGYTGSVIQIQQPRAGINQDVETKKSADESISKTTEETAVTDEKATKPSGIATIVSVRSKQLQGGDDRSILEDLESQYGHITVLQKNSIGPALANELLINGGLALALAYLLIVGYLTFRFQFDFAICAMLALVHDTLFLLGLFAMFGALFHTEVDSLFITAMLTVVGFSVHDTIVVFDRIRENNRLLFTKKVPFVKIVNMSVNQTLARSINTSLTVLLSMVAMYFFGGETTRDFVLAIIIGVAAGTYSSIFNASVMLAMWRARKEPAVQAAAA